MTDDKPVRQGRKRLVRRTDQAMLAGVAAGVADFLDVDPTLVRLGFAVLAFFGGTGILLYLVMWVIVPKPDQITAPPRDVARSNVDDIVGEARKASGSVRDAFSGSRSKTDEA